VSGLGGLPRRWISVEKHDEENARLDTMPRLQHSDLRDASPVLEPILQFPRYCSRLTCLVLWSCTLSKGFLGLEPPPNRTRHIVAPIPCRLSLYISALVLHSVSLHLFPDPRSLRRAASRSTGRRAAGSKMPW
jgi:hypothetical protein